MGKTDVSIFLFLKVFILIRTVLSREVQKLLHGRTVSDTTEPIGAWQSDLTNDFWANGRERRWIFPWDRWANESGFSSLSVCVRAWERGRKTSLEFLISIAQIYVLFKFYRWAVNSVGGQSSVILLSEKRRFKMSLDLEWEEHTIGHMLGLLKSSVIWIFES